MTMPLRAADPITVNVALGARSYEIVIGRGLISSLGQRIAALRPGARAAIVTDATVASHHLAAAQSALAAAGIDATPVTVPAGEGSKSFPMLADVCEQLIAARIERGDLVVALGGGLIGDAAFFAWLEANWRDLFSGGAAREHAIAVSCRMKAATVARDERETGE